MSSESLQGAVSHLDRYGYFIDPISNEVLEALATHGEDDLRASHQVKELLEYFSGHNGWAWGEEYHGRLLRIHEAIGLGEPEIRYTRERFDWGPGEALSLRDLHDYIQPQEQLRIDDYQGRMLLLEKGQGLLYEVLEAFEPISHPRGFIHPVSMSHPAGGMYKGHAVNLVPQLTRSDMVVLGFNGAISDTIRMVPPGVETTLNEHQEERYSHQGKSILATRLALVDDTGYVLSVLPSKIELIPATDDELEALATARWRISDSVRTIHTLFAELAEAGDGSKPTIQVDDALYRLSDLDRNEEALVLEKVYKEDDYQRMQILDVSPEGSEIRHFTMRGREWVMDLVAGPDNRVGVWGLTIYDTAQELDALRYQLMQAVEYDIPKTSGQ